MKFADAHLAHQDPQWLSHTYRYMEWYKRNKVNYASIFSSLLKGWGKNNLLMMMIVSSLWALEGCSAWLQWVTETGTWSHQQQSGHASSFHWTRSSLAPGPAAGRLHVTELQHEHWLRQRTLNDCYLHILLPEQWGPTWSWHSIHTSAGPWTCAPGRQ